MRLSVLTENLASGKFLAEHGVSYFIEHNDKSILFDTGHSNVFLQNAQKLNINFENTDTLVLSHGHWDHGNGLKYLNNKRLICHPDVFLKRYSKSHHLYVGLDLSFEEISKKFELVLTHKPYFISNKIIFLGEIPRLNDFEAQSTSFVDDKNIDDFVIDDSALVIIDDNKLIIISGCAHSGICNIIDYAQKFTGINNIKAVLGGFHLLSDDSQLRKTIDFMKKLDIDSILPSHCTQLPALSHFYQEFGVKQLKTGIVLDF